MIVRGAADVAGDNVAAPTFSFDHLPRFMRVVAGESILDDDIRAFAREPDCNPAADAPATAGHQRGFSLQSHRRLLAWQQIGRAACREECVSTCRSRWSPYH